MSQNLYTRVNPLYDVTIASDGTGVSYIDPTEGPSQIPDITGNAGAFLKVNNTATNVEWGSFSGTGGINISQVNLGDGTDTAPSLTFQSDPDLGLRRAGANYLRVVGNNEVLADFNTTHFRPRKPIHAEIGSAAAPSYSWESDPDTGIYRKSADTLAITTGGVEKVDINHLTTDFNTDLHLFKSTAPNIQSQTTISDTGDFRWTSPIYNTVYNRYYVVCTRGSGTGIPRVRSYDSNYSNPIDHTAPLNIQYFTIAFNPVDGKMIVSDYNTPASSWLVSTDGTTFTTFTRPTGANISNRMKYINNTWISCGHNGALTYSTNNGTTWTNITMSGTPRILRDIEWNGVCYVCSTDSGLFYGTDITTANTWVAATAPVSTNTRQVKWNGFIFACACLDNNNYCITSADGITWTAGNTPATLGTTTGETVIEWSSECQCWVLPSNTTSSTGIVYFSRDAKNWSAANPALPNTEYYNCLYTPHNDSFILSHNNIANSSLTHFKLPRIRTISLQNSGVSIGTSSFNQNLTVNGNLSVSENVSTALKLPLGAVGTPSYTFTGNTNTGIYSPTTNQIAITTNSVINTNFTTTGVDIGTTGANRNLKVFGNLEYTGTLTGTIPIPTNIGNPCYSTAELGFGVATIDADINVPRYIAAWCGQTLPSKTNIVTLKNLGSAGNGKTFYWFRQTGDVNNACQFSNDSNADAIVFYWDKFNNRETHYVVPHGTGFTTHNANENYSFSWWKFLYMNAGGHRWIVKELGSSWE